MAQTRAQKAAAAAKAAKAAKTAVPPETAAASATSVPAAGVSAPAIDKSKKIAGENQSTVFVVSKIPRGLYLDIFDSFEQLVPVKGGFEKRIMRPRLPERVRLRPAVLAFGLIPTYPIVDGFSITKDIPARHWKLFIEQNPEFDPLVEGLIAAFDTEADAVAYCHEHVGMRTGMEPLQQENDPRVQSSMNHNVGDVEIDDETPRPKAA